MFSLRTKTVPEAKGKPQSLDVKSFVKVDKAPSVPPGPMLTRHKPKGRKKKKGVPGVTRIHLLRLSHRPESGAFLKNWIAKHRSSPPSEEAVSLASSFVNVNTIYEFRLSRLFGKSSDVGGTVNEYFSNDPSSYAEWSSLTALFSQVKIRRAMARFARGYQGPVGTTVGVGSFRPMVVNANFDDIGTPGSYAGALDSPLNRVWHIDFDQSQLALELHLDFVGEHEPLWADVTTPASSTLYQGCPGCFQMFQDTTTASVEVCTVVQDVYILMMNRY